jgi:hypothetical protein
MGHILMIVVLDRANSLPGVILASIADVLLQRANSGSGPTAE